MPNYMLVIDDDPLQCRILEELLEKRFSCEVRSVNSAEAGLKLLAEPAGSRVAAALVDLSMQGMDGVGFIQAARPLYPNLPMVVVTAHSDLARAVEAMKAGANDFVLKQDAPERLEAIVRNVLKISTLSREVERLERQTKGLVRFSDIIGHSSAFVHAINHARQAAESNIPVLIEGESGVGKELFARAIHGESARANGPFVAVNCGAIPEGLAESILFGHEKGAFSGAAEKTEGKFREADGGTLFLDEIAELKPDLQVKLLRALQQSEVDPVGGKKPVRVNVRVISATNHSLEQAVAEGKFRQDLFYRLNVFPLKVPSLQERKEDIPLLANYLRARFAARENRPVQSITPEAMELLMAYPWPGNIRQLENALFRAVVLATGESLSPREFPEVRQVLQGVQPIADRNHAAISSDIALCDSSGLVRSLNSIERDIIRAALKVCEGCVSEVARRLKISRSTLYRKMTDYDIGAPAKALPAATQNAPLAARMPLTLVK